ncbi:hypothetical protein [Undibacterium luofuense]|uniref:Uncharacterized protein n=1 Tax=Undibacterium luofuense TaxID=2828733 RepID=A0A941DIW9_9BURK|nr:hypothetical protein [Undibacterium luofuense]MBR7781787.1 hypothetical protein [Undibacterium luofuense]
MRKIQISAKAFAVQAVVRFVLTELLTFSAFMAVFYSGVLRGHRPAGAELAGLVLALCWLGWRALRQLKEWRRDPANGDAPVPSGQAYAMVERKLLVIRQGMFETRIDLTADTMIAVEQIAPVSLVTSGAEKGLRIRLNRWMSFRLTGAVPYVNQLISDIAQYRVVDTKYTALTA